MSETESSFAAPDAPRLRAEPFRLFFPLGVLLGWAAGTWIAGSALWLGYLAPRLAR